MTKEQIEHHLLLRSARLERIGHPRTKAETYEKDMLLHDMAKLNEMLSKLEAEKK